MPELRHDREVLSHFCVLGTCSGAHLTSESTKARTPARLRLRRSDLKVRYSRTTLRETEYAPQAFHQQSVQWQL
jgi:hypothetical protein